MKKALEKIIEAFEALFEQELVRFAFKRLLIALVPMSVLLYAASRMQWEWGRNALLSIGNIWLFVVLAVSVGALSRAVYLWSEKKSTPDMPSCISYSMEFAPAYILIPAIIVIASFALKVISVGILYLGNTPWIGEMLLSLLILPMIIAGASAFFLFTVGIFFAPAVIAVEEEGIVHTFKRIFSIANHLPLQSFLYFAAGIFSTLCLTSVLFFFLRMATLSLRSLGFWLLGHKFTNFLSAVGGNIVVLQNKFQDGSIPLTYHVSAFLVYVSLGLLASLVLVLPFVYMCSVSTLLYDVLRKEETTFRDKGGEPLISSQVVSQATLDQRIKCSGCGSMNRNDLSFCTSCGNKLTEEKEEIE